MKENKTEKFAAIRFIIDKFVNNFIINYYMDEFLQSMKS